MLRGAVVSGLLASGAHVLDLGILPTPALQYYVKERAMAGGVIVTASHNPPEWNGIKVVDRRGMEIPREAEEQNQAPVEAGALAVPPRRVGGGTASASDALDLDLPGIAAEGGRQAN